MGEMTNFSIRPATPADLATLVAFTLAEATEAGAAVVAYGKWINSIINLVIVGFVMFLIVKAYNKTKKPAPAPAPKGPTQEELLTQIRDLLKK